MTTLVISYSRQDQAPLREIVALLKAAFRDVERTVFWDGDIEPGDEWFRVFQGAVDEAGQVFVFWCSHSSESTQVRREFIYALDKGKRVVPVLLDNTPLSVELAPINGLDLRRTVLHEPGRQFRISLSETLTVTDAAFSAGPGVAEAYAELARLRDTAVVVITSFEPYLAQPDGQIGGW